MHEPTEADWLEGNDPMTTRERFEDATNNEYTPTTDEIRDYVEIGGEPRPWDPPTPEIDAARVAAFDRWLAVVIVDAKAEGAAGKGRELLQLANSVVEQTERAEQAETKLAAVEAEIEDWERAPEGELAPVRGVAEIFRAVLAATGQEEVNHA